MATVRFSGELKDRIIKAAKEKMQPAVDILIMLALVDLFPCKKGGGV